MTPEQNTPEQNEKLKEMNYSPQEDIFNKEEMVPMDGDGNPILGENSNDGMPYGLDIPGSEDDDNFEQITSQIPTEVESLHNEDLLEDELEDDEDDI